MRNPDGKTSPGGWRRLLNPFDLFVLSGATMNLIVVAWLVGYWLLHG